jgi:hypothetical protein
MCKLHRPAFAPSATLVHLKATIRSSYVDGGLDSMIQINGSPNLGYCSHCGVSTQRLYGGQ